MNRLEALVSRMPQQLDGALITTGVNRRYYTGFSSSAGVVLATRKGCWFITDTRYFEAAQRAVKSCRVLLQDKLFEQLQGLMKDAGVKTLAVENAGMSLRGFGEYGAKLPGAELVGDSWLSDAIATQRRVKEPGEIESMRRAQAIADRTFTHILNHIQAGKTEREIALEMEFYSRSIGSEGPSFDFIVVSGKNSSMPHGVPSDKRLEAGDFVTMDFGAIVDGYCSDMTRTVAVGQVSDRQRDVYQTVLRAQLAVFDHIKPGAVCREVDKIARDIIEASPYRGAFGHGLGHSLGLEVHEEPRFNPTCEVRLEAGVVMSNEPGIYLAGEFGVRIEDCVVVTESGYENLAASPKELLIL